MRLPGWLIRRCPSVAGEPRLGAQWEGLMNKISITGLAAAVVVIVVGAAAYAHFAGDPRAAEIVEYFSAHTHAEDGATSGAPQHSGGTNRYGCHNASVPYHCH